MTLAVEYNADQHLVGAVGYHHQITVCVFAHELVGEQLIQD